MVIIANSATRIYTVYMESHRYDHLTAEAEAQRRWADARLFAAKSGKPKRKKYILPQFSYPSGEGLHVGHPLGYTATDILARYWRHQGCDVLHPVGFDAFGLPAENYAIKVGVPPAESTATNIA